MATKTIGFTGAGNHWRWVGNYWKEVQVGQLVTMPEGGRVTQIRLKVAGLGPYSDPEYHDQQDPTKVAAAIWDANTGDIITKSAVVQLDPEAGGSQTWKTFDVTDVWIEAGRELIVGFWRIKTTTSWATQWDYAETAGSVGQTYVQHDTYATLSSGPIDFVISDSTSDRSINYEVTYVAGGHVKVWDGSAWRDAVPRVWDGSQWVEARVKTWDGADWIESIT